jgi:hypothetical protein
VTPARNMVLLVAAALVAAPGTVDAESVAFTYAYSIYADGKDKEMPLKSPEGVACTDSAVVVADTGNRRLLTFSLKTGRAGTGTEVKLTQLTSPARVQVDTKGNLLALDGKTHRIVRVGANGGFGGYLEVSGASSPALGTVVGAFKLDGADNVYLLDIAAGKVVVADPAGKVTRELPLPSGMFTDIAVDVAGTLFAVDAVTATVWSADKSATAFKPLTGSLKDRMNFPIYMTASKGKLFLVDQYGSGIVLLGLDGAYLGRQLSIGWSDGLVNYPAQLCINDHGEAFVADRFNNRVQNFAIR